MPTRIDVCGGCEEVSGHFHFFTSATSKCTPSTFFRTGYQVFQCCWRLGLLAFEFLGCGGRAMPEAWCPTFLDSIPQILVAASSVVMTRNISGYGQKCPEEQNLCPVENECFVFSKFPSENYQKTHCPKSSSTATDGPPALTSPLIAQEREADEGPAVDSAPHSCHGQASLTPLASCDTVPSWLAAPLYLWPSQHHSEAVALVD